MRPILPPDLRLPRSVRSAIEDDYVRLADADAPVEAQVRDRYAIDLSASLAGRPLRHPFGKASGQLSLKAGQVRADGEAGLAFVVLKTVIGESPGGTSRMADWKVPAARMLVERIRSGRGEEGWTVSWLGRGWEGSLEEYADFVREAVTAARPFDLPVVPSVKLHVPTGGEDYDEPEYEHTLGRLVEAWRDAGAGTAMPVEKDFSPTLAASDLARDPEIVLRWIEEVPRRMCRAVGDHPILVGLKVMNALRDEGFQLDLLRAATRASSEISFLTCFNRLFDPDRELDGHRGICYGGPDLSDRNLRVLERWALEPHPEIPISATGNIESGRTMAEYALRGATSGQLHTFFQLPRAEYRSKRPRSRAALHELIYHPERGLVAAMEHLRSMAGRPRGGLAFLDLPALGREIVRSRDG